ncbi:MAG: xanthan lyase [Candidatus Amulumruptor caecigallinarius]|nr:xanthan lyase [Candidatus Amulumruptor caecigallinarius]
MKPHRILNIFLSILILFTAVQTPLYMEAKKSKAKTAQTSKKKSAKKKRKKSVNAKGKSSKKSAKGKKSRNSKKKKNSGRKNVARSVYKAPPKEQPQNDSLTLTVNSALLAWVPKQLDPGGLRVNSVRPDKKSRIASVHLNENFTYLPVTNQMIENISREVKRSLPDSLSDYRVTLSVGNKSLAYYIAHIDKLPPEHRKNPPFVEEVNPLVHATKGMDNDIVALWHSHGRYFKNGSWQWQRPLLFQSIEDTYTMSYILPYVVPMLENAGAYVLLPRERDTNRNEVIVDNDTNPEGQLFSQTTYKEMSGSTKWETGEEEGFIYDLPDFRDTENPFENGTYRQTKTVKGGTPAVAAWYADIPEDGEYAVYVSYKTLPNSTTDARYTVNYSGGSKEFKVNQTMGGSTWTYLGTFPFESGYSDVEPVVTLTNQTAGAAGTIVTADAIKIGGGMGNIARSPHRSDVYYDPSTPEESKDAPESEEEAETDEETDETTAESGDDIADSADNTPAETPKEEPAKKGVAPTFRTSGMPRFLEGARYWLHWAGFPEYVYSPYHGRDDYKDDYTGRGHWVNYLAGGSRVLPGREGLNIPVDAAFALHSDAGKRSDDSFVGTLGIYFSQNGDSYQDGTPRINSRMLTDMVMQQITRDIRQTYEPKWTRRSMWDKSYVEARVPEVPTTLIELMSHQNFADMKYGLDPAFKFTVGRAIYKGIARFISERKDRKLVIQPLPVGDFHIRQLKRDHYRLSWAPTPDPLEPTAMPDRYIIMERSGDDLGFHKIGETKSTHFDIRVTDHDVHSFRIIAANEGGVAFPSETLALREGSANSRPALIVNGFTRVSGPGNFSADGQAGFTAESDFGVPYIKDISFTGYQTEFRRSAGEGFGRSNRNYITQIIAGNTFDYIAEHGEALGLQDEGFVSSSVAAVEKGEVKLSDYQLVDLILGKQKRTVVGNGHSGVKFAAFPEELQDKLTAYVKKGGDLIVSGEYVISDLTDMRSSGKDRIFASEFLGSEGGAQETSKSGHLTNRLNGRTLEYSATLNEDRYIVELPDAIVPAEGVSTTELLTFPDTGHRAGQIVEYGKGKVAVLTVPVEAMTNNDNRNDLMRQIVKMLKK